MNGININHLRVIKHFSTKDFPKISDVEKFLQQYVSIPTARKIIKELVDAEIVEVTPSTKDKRIKYLTVIKKDVDQFL